MHKYLKLLILTVVSMAISCSTIKDDMFRPIPIHKNVDLEFQEYLSDFISIDPSKTKALNKYKITIGFYNFKNSIAGVCFYFPNNIREISVNPSTWERSSYEDRWELITHELVHCLCNRDHTWKGGKYKEASEEDRVPRTEENGYFSDGCSMSIMHPRMQGAYCVGAHEAHYRSELFEGCDP
jgi:hypothetical protein